MKAAVYLVEGRSHEDHLTAMARGLRQHEIEVSFFNSDPAADADFAVVWSWRVGLRIRQQFNRPILVMERGYLGDRFAWTSLGWDGLNGRARFPKVSDPNRFKAHFGSLLRPWSSKGGDALIVGQVQGDAALTNVNILSWYRQTATALYREGWEVRFRQHPVEVERGVAPPRIPFARPAEGSLTEALDRAGIVCTFNSNTGVDAILAGRPVHAADAGSMVFGLASRDFRPVRPCRKARLYELAWCQWTFDEIRSGAAWEIVKQAM